MYNITLFSAAEEAHTVVEYASEEDPLFTTFYYPDQVRLEKTIAPLFSSLTPHESGQHPIDLYDYALIEMNLTGGFETLVPLLVSLIWQEGTRSKAFLWDSLPPLTEHMREEVAEILLRFHALPSYHEQAFFIRDIRERFSHNPLIVYFTMLWETASHVKELYKKEASYLQLLYGEKIRDGAAQQKRIDIETPAIPHYNQIPKHARPKGAVVLSNYYGITEEPLPFTELMNDLHFFLQCSFKEQVEGLGWYVTGRDGRSFRFRSFGQTAPTQQTLNALPLPTSGEYNPLFIESPRIVPGINGYRELFESISSQTEVTTLGETHEQRYSFAETCARCAFSFADRILLIRSSFVPQFSLVNNCLFGANLSLPISINPLYEALAKKSTFFTFRFHEKILNTEKSYEDVIKEIDEYYEGGISNYFPCRSSINENKWDIAASFCNVIKEILSLRKEIYSRQVMISMHTTLPYFPIEPHNLSA